ncbi:MAG: pilus assembly protein PilB [Zetaproteobacteria bacterium CG06_land_8_20_14_3_00_59_53]|nr:MAG: pilus assembly protein PilB [Zetaproteobacteria bacterium CG06_land_8_20_14_3_00_59_53]
MLLRLQRQLIEAGVVSQEQLTQASELQKETNSKMLAALLKVPGVDADRLLRSLAGIYKLPYLDVSAIKPEQRLLDRCSEAFCREHHFVPIDETESHVAVAIVDPLDFSALDALRFNLGKKIMPCFAHPEAISRRIQELYQSESDFDMSVGDMAMDGDGGAELLQTEKKKDEDLSLDDIQRGAGDSPIIKLVNGIMVKALKMKASDIHIEPGETGSVVRMRLDGKLHPTLKFPAKIHPLVASRIKIMSKLDISNSRIPQDGRTRIKIWDRYFDLRVSTLPSMHGEKVVLRILDKSGLSLSLDVLGFEKTADARVRECIKRPTGAVLVTGPTGSGKTTTLYSFLHSINDQETNIITVEDPVEFQIKGINQVQVNNAAGMNFAAALRSILRQDPDVVMVGEIRDHETAEIALHAAQTGHLVLSTLHTNDAASTISRLLDMKIDAPSLAASLNMVVAQRLVRRLCPHCKVLQEPPEDLAQRIDIPKGLTFYAPKGCKQCSDIGYKGRLGVHEVLYVTDQMRELIGKGGSARDLLRLAREEGMFTLFEDGLSKALQGVTSLAEVSSVGAPPEGFKLAERISSDRVVSLPEAKAMRNRASELDPTREGKARVLVVDDSASVRNLVKFVLSAQGYVTLEAEDGQEAWRMLQQDTFDLVLSDYEMPHMAGPELVQRIREQGKFDGMPVMLLTSRDSEEDEVEGLETGADDYIIKPVEPLKLQARVKKVMGMYRRMRLAVLGAANG